MTITEKLYTALKTEPFGAATTTLLSSLTSWSGRYVSLYGFSSASLLNGGVFGIIADRTARLVEVAIKHFNVKTMLDKKKNPNLNNLGFAVSYLAGGAAAFGICLAASTVGVFGSVSLIQAVALTVLALAVRKFVPADEWANKATTWVKAQYTSMMTPKTTTPELKT